MNRYLPEKIYSLDVLRGLAALSVVFWHWQHFFYIGDKPSNFIVDKQPLYNYLYIFYLHGDLAVELFFCISGFIFYWLYSKKITERKIGMVEFSLNRLSRLYPLYILTFLCVAALQLLYIKSHNSYFVYQINNTFHALLNILMIPAWGMEDGWSFNAPVWSVSIEIMLYTIFFITCLFGKLRYFSIPFFVLSGFYIFQFNYKIGIGLFSFFCGATAFTVTDKLINKLNRGLCITIASSCLLVSWGLIFYFHTHNAFIVTAFGFTSLILFLAFISCENENFLKKINWVGNLSYSSYLIHFPLQIVFALTIDIFGLDRRVFYSPISLISFMLLLILLSMASHKFYEMPAQRIIRGLISKKSN
ncbi:acyltransferase [Serratia plymuthica]|uniref:acyltransferase family protein n=1 Tax=Serratia plymuthica TaxID=82996 RepID=UPI001F53CF28|nr:acyltransferase [Serratia plymuthica]UNK26344.1 acyltransferase [Serratia plymuthica]